MSEVINKKIYLCELESSIASLVCNIEQLQVSKLRASKRNNAKTLNSEGFSVSYENVANIQKMIMDERKLLHQQRILYNRIVPMTEEQFLNWHNSVRFESKQRAWVMGVKHV